MIIVAFSRTARPDAPSSSLPLFPPDQPIFNFYFPPSALSFSSHLTAAAMMMPGHRQQEEKEWKWRQRRVGKKGGEKIAKYLLSLNRTGKKNQLCKFCLFQDPFKAGQLSDIGNFLGRKTVGNAGEGGNGKVGGRDGFLVDGRGGCNRKWPDWLSSVLASLAWLGKGWEEEGGRKEWRRECGLEERKRAEDRQRGSGGGGRHGDYKTVAAKGGDEDANAAVKVSSSFVVVVSRQRVFFSA